jgi:hypothetical protein
VINRNLTNLKLRLKNDYPEFPVEQTNKLIVGELIKLKKIPKNLTQLDFDSIEKNIESILNKGLQTQFDFTNRTKLKNEIIANEIDALGTDFLNIDIERKPITTKEWFNHQLNIKKNDVDYVSNTKLKKIMKSVGVLVLRNSNLNDNLRQLDTYLKTKDPYANRLKTLIQNGKLKKSTNVDDFIRLIFK